MPRVEVDITSGTPPEPGGEPPVHGTVRVPDGPVVEFQGWVGLLALLQQALIPDGELGE